MAEPITTGTATVVGGAAGIGGAGALWGLLKWFGKREVERNDKRHDAHETAIAGLRDRIEEVADGCIGEETIQALRTDFQQHRTEVNGRLDTIIGHLLKKG